MNKILLLTLSLFVAAPSISYARERPAPARCPAVCDSEIYQVRLFFGLSIPGGGSVTLEQWKEFQTKEIATAFEGFNVVDSTGFYKSEAEPSKIVTVIVKESDVVKAKTIAQRYARLFKQDSVMLVKEPVKEWDFIEGDKPPVKFEKAAKAKQ
jgi:hypothetical protein